MNAELLVKDICEIGHFFTALEKCVALKNLFSRSAINNKCLRLFKVECGINCAEPASEEAAIDGVDFGCLDRVLPTCIKIKK